MSEWGRNMIERELPRTISSLNGLQSTQKEDPGFLEGLIGGGAGTLGGIFDFADAMTGYGRTPGDYLNNIARRNARTKEYTWTDMIPFMSDYYTNSQGFNYGLGQTLGSSLPLMLGGGTVGIGAKGLAALGGGALARSLGSTLARKGAAIGLASAPFEAAAEGGNLYRNMTTANPNGGFDFSDAQGQSAALEAFWKNLPLLAVGNAFEGALLGGVKLPGLSPKVGDGILARAAKGALPPMFANAAQEGATEMLQEGISGNLMGEKVWDIYDSGTWSNPFSEQQKLAGAEAALGAGLMAGGPGAYRGYKSRPQEETRNHEEQLPQIEGRDPFLQIEGAPILQLGAGKGTAPQLEIDDGTEDWNGVEDETKMAANSFGQFLRSNFGINPVITSGKRSKENNAKWEGSPTSWHLKGRAVDLYIGDVSDDQAAQIKQAAESAGWGEVLYHNAGSGKHLHLADYKGGAVGAPAMSDMEQRMWQLAQRSSQKTGIPADWIYAQWYHESDGFSSELAKGNNNFAGVTQSEPNGEENRQPDGGNYYMQFESPEAWEDYYSRFIQKFKGATSAKDYRQWAQNLHDDGYFTDSVENYVAGLERGMKGLSERRRSKEQHTNTSAAAQEVIDWTKGFSDQENYLDFFDEPLPPNVQFMQNYAAQGEAKTDGDQITAEMLPLNAQTPEGQRRQETPQTTAKYKAPPIRQFTTEDIAPPEMPNILQGLNSAPRNLPRYDIPVDFQGDILMNPQETNEQIQSPTIDAARPPHNKTEHSTAEINRMKQEFRSLVLNNEMDKAKEVGNRLFAVEDKVKMLEFMRGIQEEMQYPSEPMQDVEIGSALLSLLNENRLPANDNLRRDLLANKPLAIKSARRKLKAAGVQIPVLPSKAKTYGERLIEAAKNSGVAVNNYLRNDLLKSMPKAIKVAERRLTDAGIDVGALKNDTRDNQRKNGYEENQYANLIEELRRQSEEIVPRADTRDKTPEAQNKEQANTDTDAKTDRFGSEDEALSEMLKAFGIEEQKKTFNVIDDSDAALEAALSEFNAELSANPVFNPKLMTAAFKIGMIHLQRGLNRLADWSKAMLATSPKLKPFLPSVWDAVQAYPKDLKFDENKMMAVMRYVGTQYDKGIKDKAVLKSQLEKMIGKEYAKLIEPAFAGVEKFPTKEEIDHGTNDSADPVAARDRQGADQDEVGQDDASREPGGGGRQGISKADRQGGQPQRGVPVHEPRANARGTGSDLSIRREKSADTGSIAGTADVSGSLRDGAQGESLLDDGRTGRDIKPPEDRRDNANDLKPKKNQFRAGDLENIRNDLPMLLPEQQEDVVFAERRLLENKKGGVLFTNGTGTGKTFTGLGIIKRFVNQGKSNILIVSPSDKINEDWFNAAKDYFDLTITPLDSVKDKGKGVTITTYANLGTNNDLVNRDWDLIVADEAHTLMSSEDGKETKALKHVRALTYHDRGLGERFTCMHSEKLREIKALSDEIRQLEQDMKKEKGKSKEEIQGRVKKLSDQYDQLYKSYNEKQNAAIKEWGQIKPEERPKVTFLSATPFPYVADIDYAEGYLFDYEKVERGAYNSPNGQQKFMTDNFGYRMRFGKLTRPESDVDNEVLEIQFHDKLVQDGAMSGRSLIVDKDYDRGFILVDAGIGRKIDDGFKWLMDRKNGNFAQLAEYINKNFSHLKKNYLLEAIKAREAVPLIKDYLASGKKVVVFHNLVKDGSIHPFALEINDMPGEVRKQYREFAAKRPDLIGLNLHNLKSPIETLKDAFGNDLLLYNGDNESTRNRNVDMFNDDDSGKNIILVQSDAGQAGINLHDKTGKYPRVLINLGMPVKPVAAMQIEGRIYRTGQKSNAIFRYLNTGTMFERMAFASKIAGRVGTAENLALGKDARSLRQSFIDAFMETVDSDDWRSRLPGAKGEGTGGKAMDREKRTNLSDFDRAKSYYFAQAKKTSKTKSAEGVDYFATPEPLGYKMVEWANIQKGEKVLEPSAGHGAIARWFGSDTENVMIEPSEKLASVAQMSARGNVIRQRFEDYHIGNKFNAIVMNPPFGRGGKTAIEHIAKAFGHLRDGGRIVAIVPDGPSTQKYFDKWYYGDENAPDKAGREGKKDAVLVKEVLLPSVTFERAGTKVNCKVLVIDKQATKEGRGTIYEGGTVDLRDAETIKEFFDRVEHISIPERTKIGAEKEGDESVTSEAQANSNFDADIFSHTKTGEQIPRAAFKQFVDDYKSVSSLAKRHGGYYSRIAKGFLFKDNPEGRDAFVKEADALLNGRDIRMSAESSISFDDALNRMEFIADDQLTRQERAIKEMGRQLGVPVVFYDIADLSELRGFHASGVSFINRRANMPLNWVFWHESFHWLKQNNPSIYRDMVNYIAGKDGFTQKQIDAYKEQTGRADLSNEAAIEEMLADFMPQVSRRVGLMKQLAKENPTLAEHFVAWVRDMLDRFRAAFSAVGLSVEQKYGMTEAFLNLARDMIGPDGKRLFDVRRGQVYLRRNGRPAKSALSADSAVAYSSGKEMQEAIDKGVNLEDNLTKEEEAYLEEFAKGVVEKIEKDGEQILKRFNPADGLEALRERFISPNVKETRRQWLGFYRKHPESNLGILKLGQATRLLNLERKEFIQNDDILRVLYGAVEKAAARGSYQGILERIRGFRRDSAELGRSSADHRRRGSGDVAGRSSAWNNLDIPAESEPQERGGHLAAYKEALQKYEALQKKKKAAQEAYDKEHSKEGAFSMPEKTKYSFTDDEIAAQVKESTGMNIRLIPERFVSPSLKRIMRLGEQMGCTVQYFDGPANMHGFHAGGKTFLNRKSSRSIQETFWHETFHWLRNNNSRLYSDLVSEIQKHSPFTKPQIAAYRKTIHLGEMRTDDGRYLKSDDDIIEEMLADKMPTVAGRLGLSKLLAKENPSLYERFVGFIDNLLQKLKDLASNSTELNQARVMEQAFYRMANDMRNAEGKQIFRANPHTKKLVLMRTGRAIGTEKLELEAALAYSSGKEMQEAIDKGVNLEDNLTKEEEAYLEEFAKGVVEKIEKDGEQILKRFSPADGLEALRDKFVSESAMKNRNKWLGVYEKAPNSNFAIIKLGEAARVLWLERKEILRNDQILRGLERLLTNANERGTYSGIIERMQGYRLSTDVQSSSGGHRFDGVRNGSHQSSSRVDLKTPAEFEPQERGGHLAAYKEALQKYEALQKKKKAAQEAYDKEHSKEGAFSMPENGLKYSIGLDSLFQRAVANLAKKLGLKSTPRANVQVDTIRRGDTLGILDMWVRSPSEIAKKHPVFKPFFDYAATAVEKQERLRNRYSQEMKKIAKLLKDPKDLEACSRILLEGDRIQKEYTARELKAAGLADNAIRAYMSIRRNMKETYELINDARQQIRKHSEHMSGAQLEALKQNKFASVLESRKVGDDQFLVTYKSPKTWRKSDVAVTEEALEEMRANENIQIVKDVDAGGGLHRISYIEQAAPLTNRTGYIPHFFHEYFIMTKTATGKQIPGKGKDKGKMIPEYKYEVVTSGKTLADTVEIANELADKNKNVQYVIRQKGFGFDGKEREIAAVVGDHEFDAMSRRVAEHTDMSVKDAKEFLKETAGVGLQGRHRFYGNALHRKGAKGFEEDLLWVLGHHFNTASRYVAMEDFKPQAIGLFERKFGRFNDDYSGNSNAQYVKDYINDVNGKPTAIENKLNETIKNNPYFQHVLGDYFGDRPALQISSGISGTMAKAKLGFLNASSALLNLTQFLNIVGRLDSYEYATEGFKRAFHPTEADQRIIDASGALDNINIAADAGGYTQSRAAGFGGAKGKLRFAFRNLNALMDKGMFFFSAIDGLMRKAAVLGAYHQAIKEKGMNPKEAMAYAKDVNREANFDYGAHDAPNIIRRGSVLTQNALQFQKYPIKQLEFMHNILCNGSKKQLYTFWLPFFLIAGLGQFPFADWLDKIIETLTGGKIKPKVDGKKMLMEFAGSSKEARLLADIAMYGGMSVVGADISARAGMGDIFGSLSMAGPAGSTVSGMVRQAANGNPIETFKAFSPGLGNILQAVAGEARTTRHRVGTTYEGWDRVLKAAGFRTMDEAVASDLRTIALTEQQRKQKREQAAIDAYIEDPTTENYRKLKELKITAKRVQNERKKKKMNNRERTIDNMSNSVREDLSGVIDYAK